MKTLIQVLRQNPILYTGYLIFAVMLTCFCWYIPKSEGFLLVNQYHCTYLDYFFILFTNLGDGLFFIVVIIFMMTRRKFIWSLQMAASFLISGATVQIVKRLIHSPRPTMYFGSQTIHFIHGVTHTGYGSFPSGHAATIFALTTLLSLYFPARKSVLLFLLLAVLTGFSRIYLSQHFPIDVLAGSVIGVTVSTAAFLLIPATYSPEHSFKLW